MARDPVPPLFLERSTYRRRRMMDAVKLVVFLGAGLWMVPVLWPMGSDTPAQAVTMSDALFYVFGVWLFLILLSGFLMRFIRGERSSEDSEALSPSYPVDGPDQIQITPKARRNARKDSA